MTDQTVPAETTVRHIGTTEAARILGMSPRTVRRHAARLGAKPFGRWRIDPAKVAEASGGAA